MWTPVILTEFGKVPDTASDYTVSCSLSSTTPMTDLNVLGGDNITFMGTNLPYEVPGNSISITFDGTQLNTPCTV